MKATFLKRLTAYIVDMIIISTILILIFNFFPENKDVQIMKQELNEVYDNVLKGEDATNYFEKFAELNYRIDKEMVMYSVLNVIAIVGYFTFIPYLFMGQTPGKRLLGIRIIRRDNELLMLNDLVLRNFIVHGLSYILIALMLIYLISAVPYFVVVTILGFIQFVLVIVSGIMIIARKDRLGLQDFISKTTVVEVE